MKKRPFQQVIVQGEPHIHVKTGEYSRIFKDDTHAHVVHMDSVSLALFNWQDWKPVRVSDDQED